MNVKYIVALLVVCALAGCRDPGSDADMGRQPALEANSGSDHRSVVPVEQLNRPLPGGLLKLPFQYHVNVDRETGRSRAGHEVREVGIELLEGTHRDLEAEVTRFLEEHGGSVEQRQESDGALRIVYSLSDGTRMLAWYRPGPPPGDRYALQQENATGTLYLAWPYVAKEAQ